MKSIKWAQIGMERIEAQEKMIPVVTESIFLLQMKVVSK